MRERVNDMHEQKRISVVLVTGFLGAGKTTFLNRLLDSTPGLKKGVLVNDFGAVPLDGTLLKDPSRDDTSIYEVGGGSIFCACLKSSFLFGLEYFIENRPDVLCIETSGLTDPSGFSTILAQHGLSDHFSIKSVVCLVDARRHLALSANLTAIERQVHCSDILLVNKCDLVAEHQLEQLEVELHRVNPRARIERTTFAEIHLEELFEQTSMRLNGQIESCNTEENRPDTLFFDTTTVTRDRLEDFLHLAAGMCYRIKGLVNLEGAVFLVSDGGKKYSVSLYATVDDGSYPLGLTLFPFPAESEKLVTLWRSVLAGAYAPQKKEKLYED